ncbi:MAG: putative selenate ABC transporter substrate-binding protein [Microthrixaceae bacterium]
MTNTIQERRSTRRPTRLLVAALAACALLGASCSNGDETTDDASGGEGELTGSITIGAIPDQDPEVLQRQFDDVSAYLEEQLPGIDVEYVPVTDYDGALAGFTTGDLDLVWFGGLTGVQAQEAVDGSVPIAQRDIDEKFTSVFIAAPDSDLGEIDDVDGLSEIAGHSLTFGSESSTSGRLMPQYFLDQAGVDVEEDLKGQPGFSGSHDATIELVTAGTYEVGALNSQVWDSAAEDGTLDDSKVVEIFRTPEYYDYHWVAQPDLDAEHGDGFTEALTQAFLGIDGSTPEQERILEAFGAEGFIPTEASNYEAIREVGEKIGVLR